MKAQILTKISISPKPFQTIRKNIPFLVFKRMNRPEKYSAVYSFIGRTKFISAQVIYLEPRYSNSESAIVSNIFFSISFQQGLILQP